MSIFVIFFKVMHKLPLKEKFMYDLKCKRKGCKYNKNCNCTAKNVEVKKDTSCKTYDPTEKSEFSEDEKIGQPPIRKDITVDCHADCLFNQSNVCSANGITVQTCDNVTCPNCCTYQPK